LTRDPDLDSEPIKLLKCPLYLRERAKRLGFSARKAVAEWVRVFDVF
jgi:hypothetical protein